MHLGLSISNFIIQARQNLTPNTLLYFYVLWIEKYVYDMLWKFGFHLVTFVAIYMTTLESLQ